MTTASTRKKKSTIAEGTSDTFQSLNPATDEVVGTYPVHTPSQVAEVVGRSREGAAFWSQLSFDERSERLRVWNTLMIKRADELAGLLQRETGKPLTDVKAELATAFTHLDWAAKNARRALRPKRVFPGILMLNNLATIEREPYGVVGVIAPWNYPVFIPIESGAYALAAGNAVVLKPSEHTPATGEWLVKTFAEVVPEAPVLSLVTGFAETGAALCRSGVDKIAFTGSTRAAKAVMAGCAENLVPVVIEAGGKDAALVDSDANIPAAAEAVVYGAFFNAGQTCVGIERAYVHGQVYDRFLAEVRKQTEGLRAGPEPSAGLGPMIMRQQIDVVRGHVDDAVNAGGEAIIGGAEAIGDRYIQPTVLVNVSESARAMHEETFGPTLTVAKVTDMDEAVRLANSSPYGLGAAVFSKRRGHELARRLRVGVVSVNTAMGYAPIAALPFGGVGQSGFGRLHGEEGLREFSRTKSIAHQKLAPPVTLISFHRTASADRLVQLLARALYSNSRLLKKFLRAT